ncbi:MAG: GGDEF domain-containing protein, partial [Nitrospina sp.]
NTLIKNADAAMFRAKQAGSNNFEFYNPAFLELATRQMSIESDLRKALDQEEFFLYYQPKIECQTENLVGLEALIRWKHPDKGWIPPCDFIPIAEENRFILRIGEWVIKTACAQLSFWKSNNLNVGSVAVNISGHQFNQSNLVQFISDTLERYSVSPDCLELEFTETILMEHSSEAISKLKALKELGVKLSIDDFGTGYSSLTYLKNMPVDHLKIDQSFVKDLDQEANQAIVQTIISLAHSLKMKTIAEGVETVEAKDFLTSLGCNIMQGYLFSPALPHEEVIKKFLIPTAKV